MPVKYKNESWALWFRWQTVRRLVTLYGDYRKEECFILLLQPKYMKAWFWAIPQKELRCLLTRQKANSLPTCAQAGPMKLLRLYHHLNLLLNEVLRLWLKMNIWSSRPQVFAYESNSWPKTTGRKPAK